MSEKQIALEKARGKDASDLTSLSSTQYQTLLQSGL